MSLGKLGGIPCKAHLNRRRGFRLQLPAILWRRGIGLKFMATEIEIKAGDSRPQGAAGGAWLNRLRGEALANPKAPRVHEMNLIFDTPDGGIGENTGSCCGFRTEDAGASEEGCSRPRVARRTVLTFKSPPGRVGRNLGDVGHVGDRPAQGA